MPRVRPFLILLFGLCLLPSASNASEVDSLRIRARGADPLRLLNSLTEEGSLESAHAAVVTASDLSIAVDDSAATCALLVARGIAELRLQKHEAGLETLARAIEWSIAARDSVRWLYALDFSTVGLDALGQLDESRETSRRMLELAIAARRPSQEAWARIGIAYAALTRGELDDALEGYSRAVALFRDDSNARDELTALVGLGRVYARLGKIDEAKSCYQKVFLVATDIDAQSNAGHALNNLGVLEHQFGDISLAIDYFERAGQHYRAGGSFGGIISSASNVADSWMNLGHYADAIAVLNTALDVATENGRRQDVGRLRSKLAWAHFEDGRPRRAEDLFRSAYAMGDTLWSKIRTETTLGFAKSLAARGERDEAIALLEQRLEHEDDSRQLSNLHILLAQMHRRGSHVNEALRNASRAFELLASFEPDRMRDSTLLELSICLRDAGKLGDAADRFDEALTAIALRRARISDEEFREARGANLGALLVEASEIRRLYPPELSQEDRDLRLYDVLKEFKSRTLMERIQATTPNRSETRSATQIQSEILSSGDLLIEFFVSTQHSWLFALTPDELRVLQIPGSDSEFATRAHDFVVLLAATPNDDHRDFNPADRVRQSLGETLFGGISDLIEPARRIIVIPDGYLHSLPFRVLSAHADSPPMMVSREIYRVPSTSFLRAPMATSTPPRPFSLVAFAGVDRDGDVLEGAQREVSTLRRNFKHASVVEGRRNAEDLHAEFADATLIHVAAHVDVNDENPWHSGILLAADDSQASSTDMSSDRSTTRGLEILSSEDSLRVRESLRGDRYLRAAEITNWDLRADLAVLSGCESALGRITVGEGVIGLGGAFLSAGVHTVVASLWPVDDRRVEPLMEVFYAGLADGKSVSAALSSAQLDLRSHDETQHPFYWAGMIVIGDGDAKIPIELRSPGPRPANLLWIAGVMAVILFLGARWRKPKPAPSR